MCGGGCCKKLKCSLLRPVSALSSLLSCPLSSLVLSPLLSSLLSCPLFFRVCTHAHTHVHTHMHTRTLSLSLCYTHTHTHTYVHTHTHTNTHTHTQSYRQTLRRKISSWLFHTHTHTSWGGRGKKSPPLWRWLDVCDAIHVCAWHDAL